VALSSRRQVLAAAAAHQEAEGVVGLLDVGLRGATTDLRDATLSVSLPVSVPTLKFIYRVQTGVGQNGSTALV
jgi:hypothetical protein